MEREGESAKTESGEKRKREGKRGREERREGNKKRKKRETEIRSNKYINSMKIRQKKRKEK